MVHKVYNVSTGLRKAKRKISVAAVGFMALAFPAILALSNGGAYAISQVIVTPSNTQGWSTADTRTGGAVNFIADSTAPGTPNNGALQLTTNATTTSKAQYLHGENTPIADVTDLGYYTRQNSASFSDGDPSYQFIVDLNGSATGGFTTFVYEPYQNGGVITPGLWQQWDVDAGQFWSSRSFEENTCVVSAGGGGAPFYTLAELKNICPDVVSIGFGVNIGSNNPSYDVETDLVNFNGTTYNFEPFTTVKVTIDKFVNGSQATTVSANNSSFPMQSTWDATNIGAGSGTYSLEPTGFNSSNSYEAVTSEMTLGANYSTNEVTGGSVVAATCTPGGAPFALVGYTTGDTLAAAQAGTPSATIPAFTSIQSDKFVIVWNKTCTTPTNKDQCKNGGWQTFNAPVFKNQGDCVSWFATKGRNPANG